MSIMCELNLNILNKKEGFVLPCSFSKPNEGGVQQIVFSFKWVYLDFT